MATNSPTQSDSSILDTFSNAEIQIEQYFAKIFKYAKEREKELLSELNTKKIENQAKLLQFQLSISQLEKTSHHITDQNILINLKQNIEYLKQETKKLGIEFQNNNPNLLDTIKSIGNLKIIFPDCISNPEPSEMNYTCSQLDSQDSDSMLTNTCTSVALISSIEILRHRKVISLLQQCSDYQKEGVPWHLIGRNWIEQWRTCDQKIVHDDDKLIYKPLPICNADIMDSNNDSLVKKITSNSGNGKLRIGTDFFAMNELSWNCLVQWYGLSNKMYEIKRCISQVGFNNAHSIDLYPTPLIREFILYGSATCGKIEFYKHNSIEIVRGKIKNFFNIDNNVPIRIFYKKSKIYEPRFVKHLDHKTNYYDFAKFNTTRDEYYYLDFTTTPVQEDWFNGIASTDKLVVTIPGVGGQWPIRCEISNNNNNNNNNSNNNNNDNNKSKNNNNVDCSISQSKRLKL